MWQLRVGASAGGAIPRKKRQWRKGSGLLLFSTGCTSHGTQTSSLTGGGEEEHPQVICACSFAEAACPCPQLLSQLVHPCRRCWQRAQHETRAMTTGRVWPTSANEVSPPSPAHPPLPVWPAPRRAVRCQTVALSLPGRRGNCQREFGGHGASRGCARAWAQCCCACCCCSLHACLSASPLCMLSPYGRVLMLPSGRDVSFCALDAYALRPYRWPWPRGPWNGCWGRLSPPAGRT